MSGVSQAYTDAGERDRNEGRARQHRLPAPGAGLPGKASRARYPGSPLDLAWTFRSSEHIDPPPSGQKKANMAAVPLQYLSYQSYKPSLVIPRNWLYLGTQTQSQQRDKFGVTVLKSINMINHTCKAWVLVWRERTFFPAKRPPGGLSVE